MKVSANIDESEVGKIRPGQRVTFRVDAYPTGQFEGAVVQVRLNPVTVQNVVSYVTVIEAPNQDMRLKPGMTANVNIEIARRDNVLRLPAAATRFRPNSEIFAALGQPVPEEMTPGRGRGQGGAQTAGGGQAQPGSQPTTGAAPGERGGQPATPGAQPATASRRRQLRKARVRAKTHRARHRRLVAVETMRAAATTPAGIAVGRT